jgi:hypothetical protein
VKLSTRIFVIVALVIFALLAGASYGFYNLGEKAGKERLDNLAHGSPPVGYLWAENGDIFLTGDVARAQEHVPFKIAFPTCLPGDSNKQISPVITGMIKPSSIGPVQVRITYYIQPKGTIFINESNRSQLAEASKQRDLQIVEISGKQIMTNSDNTVFYFDLADIGITVNSVQVPGDEMLKLVESMLQQIK